MTAVALDGTNMLRLMLTDLEDLIRAADPSAFLVLPRILRRVIKHDRRLAGLGLKVPHRKSYVIGRESLLEVVDKAELGLAEFDSLPERIILLAQPKAHVIADSPVDEILTRCWRLLFHARVHVALGNRIAEGKLSPETVRQRIFQIGTSEFDEIRTVLDQEGMLLPPIDDSSTYVEFVAAYLELRHFSGSFLTRYFPGLRNLEAIDELIRQDIDGESLFRTTRLESTPNPKDCCELDDLADAALGPELHERGPSLPETPQSGRKSRVLMRKAQRPASLGNVVRAAIYRARAERCAPPESVEQVRAAIRMDVYRLIRRLQAALEIDDAGPPQWEESLLALVSQTPSGIWTAEARLLYDLQKVCVDHERDVYTVDVVEWALSWGRRPIKRRLPNQRDVLMLKHLQSAAGRLSVVRVCESHRRQLALLIDEATRRVETRLRERLRPQISEVLDTVGLTPQNLPERVARKKMVEELLDQTGERGFLAMGDLRDAISRNNLKLPDLSRPLDFLQGDQLLQADRRLALVLDGVYRRGEFYLRWMQRLSSIGFGTGFGRFLTRFAVVPFGGAYVALAFIHHVWELIGGEKHPTESEGIHLTSMPVVLLLGAFLMCLVNSAWFRHAVGFFFKCFYDVFRGAVIEPIRWLVRSPLLQQILHSRLFTIPWRFVVKPLMWTGVVWWLWPFGDGNWRISSGTVISIFLAMNLLLNSRLGRNAEEVAADWVVLGWQRFGLRVITGLFWLVVDVFRALLEAVERLMYSVDEWLRFKSGESGVTSLAKAALGLIWFFVSYVLRFAVNVLIEPQFNPLKHFPVVTVSHKVLIPLIPHLTGVLMGVGMEKALAGIAATAIITSIPGLFGFLVWELRENWRLYKANRRPNLAPVLIGSHGESMRRLLKPGFHSGTLPKRFTKLRRAERRARDGGSWDAARKHLRAIHHVELSIRRYVEREFVELFAQSRCWEGPAITLEEVWLSTNSVRLLIGCSGSGRPALQIAMDVESGWLIAGIVEPGWVESLRSPQRQVLATALLGLYKTAGIELVRQQIEDQFTPRVPRYDVSFEGLVLWPDEDRDVEVLYDLHEGPWIAPQSIHGLSRQLLPTLARWRLIFDEVALPWRDWVVTWNYDLAGRGHPEELIASVCVLPLLSSPLSRGEAR
jgi:hypothetical protein